MICGKFFRNSLKMLPEEISFQYKEVFSVANDIAPVYRLRKLLLGSDNQKGAKVNIISKASQYH
jgi:hypothetical protein